MTEINFKMLFESLPGLYLILDKDLKIVAASDAYLHATMTRRNQIVGQHMFEAFPDNPEDPQATGVGNLRVSLERVLHTLRPDTMPMQKYDIRKPEGENGGFVERFWTPVNSPVFGPDGKLAYIIHRVEDVTEFVHLQQKREEEGHLTDDLRDQTKRMGAEILARTQEVANANRKVKKANEDLAKLYEKTKELESLKTQFFSNVSHELRTPLSLILGPVEKWLKTAGGDDQLKHDLEVVYRNARLLLRHVNDLLDVARLEAGRMMMKYADVDLSRLTRFVGFAFESLAAENDIGYSIDAPEGILAQVDPEKIQRVLLNLLSNAIKFTPVGGNVGLTLRTENNRVAIEVRDSGPGIPAHLREAVFERFRQLSGGSERRHEGTGLGLAIVKDFVILHQGSVAIEDAPGGGALFRVSLPRTAPTGVEVADAGKGLYEELGGLTVEELAVQPHSPAIQVEDHQVLPDAPLVLVVEDNPDMNAFEVQMLRQKYRVETAFDGEQGLEKALKLVPDLILTDEMMPRMSGSRMVQTIRRHRVLDDTPILLMTARADEAFLVDMLKKGAQGYFIKPFSAGELIAKVNSLIVEKKSKQELRKAVEERTRELIESRHLYLHAEKLSTVGRLSASITHEFSTPLQSILSVLKGMKMTIPEEDCKMVELAIGEAERLKQLLANLRDYARPTTGQKTPTDVHAIINDLLQLSRSIFRKKRLSVAFEPAAELPKIHSSADQIKQVVLNLLTNAVDACQPGGRILVSTRREKDGIEVAVTDNGVGIEPENLERIFQPFYSEKTKEGGTGLGLSVCSGIVKDHKGDIRVTSQPGEGSTFTVFLPTGDVS